MTPCPFTHQLALYTGPAGDLQDHLERCSECRTAAAVRATGTDGAEERTPDCPEAVVLAAYDQAVLEAEEQAVVADHVEGCRFCQWLLVQLRRDESGTDIGLSALRKGDAYVLAKELAWWLSTNQYPSEEEAVQTSFESVYERVFSGEQAEAVTEPALVGLRFSQASEASLAHRIMAASLTVAAIRMGGDAMGAAFVGRFRQESAKLFPDGEAGDLVDSVAEWIETRSNG